MGSGRLWAQNAFTAKEKTRAEVMASSVTGTMAVDKALFDKEKLPKDLFDKKK